MTGQRWAAAAVGTYFRGEVSDADGFASWSWDFGDGTKTPVERTPERCGWANGAGWASFPGISYAAHEYAEPGTYQTTFTATTTGCDRKDPQTVRKTMTWTVQE